jgi:hypothetical protein
MILLTAQPARCLVTTTNEVLPQTDEACILSIT